FYFYLFFFFSSRRRHTRSYGDWSSDVCSSDLGFSSKSDLFSVALSKCSSLRLSRSPSTRACSAACSITAPSRFAGPADHRNRLRSEERRVGKECRFGLGA